MNLHEASEADLKAEIKRRKDEAAAKERARLDAHHALIVQHVDVLLLFRPNHYGDCDDSEYSNWRNCGRCLLLDIKKTGCVFPIETEIELEIIRGHGYEL